MVRVCALFARLGLSYERARDGLPSLFTKSEGKKTELVDLKVCNWYR